jgi:hypothetical protein
MAFISGSGGEGKEDLDGADDWLFLLKIKPAKRAVSFNIFLIIEA